ncbi:MAG: S8 family serine peptidase [Clostridia bacterium]|nr:S8 family serine peptidase [Clostridia bacterium]
MRKVISILLVLIMSISIISMSFIEMAALEANTYSSKISVELIQQLKSKSEVYAYVWFSETLDISKIKVQAEKEVGFTQRDIDNLEKEKCEFEGSIFEKNSYTNEYKLFMSSTESVRRDLLSKQSQLIEKQRELVKNFYSVHNAEKIQSLGISKEKMVYTSLFSPVTIIKTNEEEIKKLSASEIVEYIGYKDTSRVNTEFSSALPAVDAKYVRNTLGYDGYGVKIGVLDGGRVIASHTELSNTNLTILDPDSEISNHATNVSRIIAGTKGVAPNVQLYTNSHNNMIEQELEELISCGVYVINMSLGIERNNGIYYTDLEKWIDHLAYQHDVTIVKSAGNKGVTADITIPGLAYNIITVGGTNTKYTVDRTDDTLFSISTASGSCSANGGTAGCAKPDFLAPAYYKDLNDYGTSFAAAMVTGIIAQMIECRPTLATKPAVIKAVLTSSTTRKMAKGISSDKVESWEDTITAQQGAGEVSARKAIYILSLGNYSIGFVSSGSLNKSIAVTSSDLYIRSSLAWLRNNTVSQHTNGAVSVGTAANYKLKAYRPDGSICGESNIPTSSVELVHFNVNGIYGTYNIEISRADSNGGVVEYAFAWR